MNFANNVSTQDVLGISRSKREVIDLVLEGLECVWYKKLEELRSFFELNKRRPIQTSTDIDEIILARWVSNQLIIRRQKDIESTLNVSLLTMEKKI